LATFSDVYFYIYIDMYTNVNITMPGFWPEVQLNLRDVGSETS